MNALLKYKRLPAPERLLLLRTAALLALFRLALWILPYRSLRRWMEAALKGQARRKSLPHDVDRLTWAVRAASRAVPAATCLTQALALHFLLTRAGHPARVQIGVAKDATEGFQAHAWVDSDGRVLLNRPTELARYAHLTSLEISAK